MKPPRFIRSAALVCGLVFVLLVGTAACAEYRTSKFSFEGRQVAIDTYPADSKGGPAKGTLILLHGASGPDMPVYRQQAEFFSSQGFTVAVPHYFDATKATAASAQNYAIWARLIAAFTGSLDGDAKTGGSRIFVIGFSLGASVALAAGSHGLPVAAIAEWYGSLPDEFFETFKSMPPLLILHGERDTNVPVFNAQQLVKLCGIKQLSCESHIYEDQAHGFTGKALEDADARTLEFFARKFARKTVAGLDGFHGRVGV